LIILPKNIYRILKLGNGNMAMDRDGWLKPSSPATNERLENTSPPRIWIT
jgi:hypothetical protein